jgi:hypothetical protein
VKESADYIAVPNTEAKTKKRRPLHRVRSDRFKCRQ